MGEVLIVLLLLFGSVGLGVVATAWLAWRWLRRRNEISVDHPTRPPLRWLISPESCARLHRRLAKAVGVVRLTMRTTRRRRNKGPFASLAADIETQALALDHDLMIAVHLRGQSGMVMRRQVTSGVEMIERIAHRLASVSASSAIADAEPTAEALHRITEYLDTLDAARAEIARIERDAGLFLPA
jgi:hypothetical protein